MKVAVAVDSFKGSLSANDVCAAVRAGILRVYQGCEVIEIPLADGGEGTAEHLVRATEGVLREVTVTGPLGQPVRAKYGVLGDGVTAVIEMAQASGLSLVPEASRNPLLTTSYGTGELIRHALDCGHRKFLIGLGGSASQDGGAGMFRALGMRFLDERGRELEAGGAALLRLARIEAKGLDARLGESTFVVASDVQNRLVGPAGASAVFAPQKGATQEMVERLDAALTQLGEVILAERGVEVRDLLGGGAAGGIGAATVAFLNASIRSGIEVVLAAVEFDRKIGGADLIIAGEGTLDEQTLAGKAIAGVSRAAARQGIPVLAICGGISLSGEQLEQLGVASCSSIVPGPCSLETAMDRASEWTADAVERMMRVWKAASRH